MEHLTDFSTKTLELLPFAFKLLGRLRGSVGGLLKKYIPAPPSAECRSKIVSMADSIVLLPVMTQSPSRLAYLEPPSPKELQERSTDMALFGTMTSRRKKYLQRKSTLYLEAHPGHVHAINTTLNVDLVSAVYMEAKVCLLGHAYDSEAAGEYHRVSEFAPFGCVRTELIPYRI